MDLGVLLTRINEHLANNNSPVYNYGISIGAGHNGTRFDQSQLARYSNATNEMVPRQSSSLIIEPILAQPDDYIYLASLPQQQQNMRRRRSRNPNANNVGTKRRKTNDNNTDDDDDDDDNDDNHIIRSTIPKKFTSLNGQTHDVYVRDRFGRLGKHPNSTVLVQPGTTSVLYNAVTMVTDGDSSAQQQNQQPEQQQQQEVEQQQEVDQQQESEQQQTDVSMVDDLSLQQISLVDQDVNFEHRQVLSEQSIASDSSFALNAIQAESINVTRPQPPESTSILLAPSTPLSTQPSTPIITQPSTPIITRRPYIPISTQPSTSKMALSQLPPPPPPPPPLPPMLLLEQPVIAEAVVVPTDANVQIVRQATPVTPTKQSSKTHFLSEISNWGSNIKSRLRPAKDRKIVGRKILATVNTVEPMDTQDSANVDNIVRVIIPQPPPALPPVVPVPGQRSIQQAMFDQVREAVLKRRAAIEVSDTEDNNINDDATDNDNNTSKEDENDALDWAP